ncbi:lipoprotein-34 precursor (NlpB) [Acinetobacter sp. ANC 4558]|uniref:lipoprotein-34 precursor (NlpB) n=1 Tax=Acinetobacter sp. ANC 4558 TaxID=1977876 RepID=UPI000A333E94|nr:lipoprotein-34 precursor (NlpB) [Acinetobacter sp. ANC 4558]OTG88229.1 lipoprotein-34 precursor (NlpB) [Acinetobacter sp. ANC 4558]
MQLRFGFIAALSALSFVGCSSLSIGNGSLDYKKTTTVEPLKYPEGSVVRPATPLYPAPIIDPLALENAPKVENQKGNRFSAPRPSSLSTAKAPQVSTETSKIARPQPLSDENLNPLLKVDGNSATIWQYTLSALSSLNYPITGQSKNQYEVTVKADGHSYIVKLMPINSSNMLMVFNVDHSVAEQQAAADLLAQIYQNWPA